MCIACVVLSYVCCKNCYYSGDPDPSDCCDAVKKLSEKVKSTWLRRELQNRHIQKKKSAQLIFWVENMWRKNMLHITLGNSSLTTVGKKRW